MPIKPIDIVTIAPKSQEVTQHKHMETQKLLNEQFQMNNQFNEEIRHNNMQTVKTIKSENKEYRYDAKDKGNGSFTGSNQQKKKKDKEAAPKDNLRPGSIDIKI